MAGESPVVNLFSSDGYEMAVVNSVSIPPNTRGYLVAGTDGTTTRIILMDGSSRVVVVGAGTAGTPAGGVLTIQGVALGTAVITTDTSDGAVSGGTAGTTSMLTGGVFNSGVLSLTTGQQASLQLTASGQLKTVAQSSTATGAATPANAFLMGGAATTAAPTYITGDLEPLSLNLAGGLRVDGSGVTQPISNTQTAETTAAWTSATAVNTTLALTVTNYASVVVTINQGSTITGGAVTFEVSDTVAGTNWYPVSTVTSFSALPSAAYVFVASTNVAFQLNVSGLIQFRARLSTAITGTATINIGIAASAASAPIQQEQYALLTDGANGPVAVKAPSVSALTTDPALVVAISPNNGSAGLLPVALGGPGTVDVFGQLTSAQRINQVSIPFFQAAPSSLITVTTTGSATATQGTGTGIFATGATSSSEVKGVTAATVAYSPHYELFAAFTAAFTAGVAGTYQRIGLYNTTDGFSFGYNGTAFGLWSRYNSVDTFVAQTSWNIDKLAGSVSSKFTSLGVPQTLVQADINLYRIRFGWLGISPIVYEVMAPDGNWVVVHTILLPNSQTTVSVTNPNLPMTIDVNNQAVATALTVTCGCWVAGSDAPAAVKPASTAAVAADASMVVALSPNSLLAEAGVTSLGTTTSIAATLLNNQVNMNIVDLQAGSKLDLIYYKLDDLFNLMVSAGINTYTPIKTQRSYSTTHTTFAAATSAKTYLNVNTSRTGATFINDIGSTSNLYLLLGADVGVAVSATNYTVLLVPNGYYELPYGFSGRVDGIWSATVGNVYITEISNGNL
jgi:hypothetical protein